MPQFTRNDDDLAARGTRGTRSMKQFIGDSVAVRAKKLSDGRNSGIVILLGRIQCKPRTQSERIAASSAARPALTSKMSSPLHNAQPVLSGYWLLRVAALCGLQLAKVRPGFQGYSLQGLRKKGGPVKTNYRGGHKQGLKR
jgi:hypothetical protein